MEESEAKDERQLESRDSDLDEGDEVEVEVKSSEGTGEVSGEDQAGKTDVREPADSGVSQAVVEVPSLEEQLRELEDRYLRLAAEFDNYKKRVSRQFASMIESAQADVIIELLAIQDNFERALQIDNDSGDFVGFRRGVELIFNQLVELLKKKGVETFESVGEKFDPNYHEALMTIQTDEKDEGTVIEEFAKGYRFRDRILRHAKVSVARARE